MLYKQESCVLNDGFTTMYFNLEKGARQGDPDCDICLFLHWKFFLTCQKTIPWQNILKFLTVFLYTVYADDSTFFLKDLASVKNLLDVFSHYSKYSGLQLIFSKCEITGIGSLKGVEVAVCGIKFVKLKVNTIRILGIHFSYNNKLNLEKKFLTAMSNI